MSPVTIGHWIRINDVLLLDEVGWHRVKAHEPLLGIDGIERIELCCDAVVRVDPTTCERGLPGAGAVVCEGCATWKEKK